MSCAVNITGLKYITEAVDYQVVVGERSNSDEGIPARYTGVVGSENADMSSDKIPPAENPRVPIQGQSG